MRMALVKTQSILLSVTRQLVIIIGARPDEQEGQNRRVKITIIADAVISVANEPDASSETT
ncbi:MAG TPA: hypothetical protein QGG18_11110 [Rhodospirillales bacterium]|nr:hypothetical protein [Rhodospirillales bacterium]